MVLKDIELRWTRLDGKAKKFDGIATEYTFDAIVTEEVSNKFLEDKMITKHRTNTSGEYYIPFRLNTHTKNGEETVAPKVFDKYGDELTEMLGNGTKAHVQFRTYEWEFNGKTGFKMIPVAIMVTDLVLYVKDGDAGVFDFLSKEDEVDLDLDLELDDEFE